MRKWLPISMLLLAGCATDTVRIERAGEVVQQGQPLIAASNALLDNIVDVSQQASIEMALADPLCDWPELRIATGTPAASLCDPQSSSFTTITRIDRESVAPMLKLIAALSAYVAAVDSIVADSPTDAGINLADARSQIESIAGGIAAIAGVPDPVAALTDDQKAALTGIAAMLDRLARERAQAGQLLALEANAPDLRATTAALRRDLVNWSKLALMSDLQTLQDVQTLRWQRDRLSRSNPKPTRAERAAWLSDAERRALLGRRVDIASRLTAANRLPATLSAAVGDFEAAHDQYLNILENKDLTPENRARKAEVTRQHLRESLALLAQTIAAFK